MVSKQNILISILRDPTHLSAQNGIQRTLFLKGRELCIIFWDNSHQNECANFVGLYWVDSATGWPKGSGTVILGGPDNSRVQTRMSARARTPWDQALAQPPLSAALPGGSRKESCEGERGEMHKSAGCGKGLRVSPNSVSLEVKKQKRKSYLSRAPL